MERERDRERGGGGRKKENRKGTRARRNDPVPLSLCSLAGGRAHFSQNAIVCRKTKAIKAEQTQQVERFTNNGGNRSLVSSRLFLADKFTIALSRPLRPLGNLFPSSVSYSVSILKTLLESRC